MNELIIIDEQQQTATVSGRELHKALEIGTQYTKWFDRMCEYGFTENTDFVLVSQKCPTNNPKNPYTTIIDHQLTIDMAKELCMIQRSEKGRQFRQYFIEVEKQWNDPDAVIARALKLANSKIEQLNTRIAIDKPKVEFAELMSTSDSCITMNAMAKLIQKSGVKCGVQELFQWAREHGYLMRSDGYNIPTAKAVNKGYLVLHVSMYSPKNAENAREALSARVTPRGQAAFLAGFKKLVQKRSENIQNDPKEYED